MSEGNDSNLTNIPRGRNYARMESRAEAPNLGRRKMKRENRAEFLLMGLWRGVVSLQCVKEVEEVVNK